MKLLVVTQKVDREDENLGAFYYWFEELAKKVEHLTIIASFVGKTDFPSNVTVCSLGKEQNAGRFRRLHMFFQLFSYHYAICDAVFFHQIPEFVIVASPFLLSLKKRSVLWYAHKSVTWRLTCAERLVDFIATSSEQGFRLPSKKVIYTGQAINTDLFTPKTLSPAHGSDNKLKLISVGRISPIKNYEQIINACAAGMSMWPHDWSLTIVGGPLLPRDHSYLESLKRLVEEKNMMSHIHFRGSAGYSEIPQLLRDANMFVNVSGTGSLDKAVFEAMACGLTVLTSNEAYRSIVPDRYFLEYTNPDFIAERIKQLNDEPRPNMELRTIVCERHSLEKTVYKILSLLRDTSVVTNGRSVPLYIAHR
ncbi:MAG: glycosyltransferase family 4 protein [Candidatus Sungbacteria bacterium]|nr:glycosyltransferase family 4 protein [bacterium]MDZ4260201.1 glycosyltransferase family 4 protein [Candidatus Sungbacteria bacterium]